MPAEKVKILITADCKVGGAHIDKGTIIEIDPNVAADKNNYALLVHAGRVADATPENIAKVKAEIAAEEKIKSDSVAKPAKVTLASLSPADRKALKAELAAEAA